MTSAKSEWPKCPTCGKEHTFQGWATQCCAGKDLVQRNPAPDASPVRAPTGVFIHTGPAFTTTTSTAPNRSVTDEMVDAAVDAYDLVYSGEYGANPLAMRAALVAALSAPVSLGTARQNQTS